MVHPSQYTLSADVCGPLRMPGVDPEGRSKDPKKFRYFLAVTYRFPRLHGIPQVFDPWKRWICPRTNQMMDLELALRLQGTRSWTSWSCLRLFELSGIVEHEPTSRPHGQAATALFDVEDEEEEEPADEEGPPPDHGHPEGDWELEYSDLKEPVESERLMFCVPLCDNKSPSVLQGLQQVVLYLRSLNLPVFRLHTDRSREFMNKVGTRWLLSQAIRLTTTEGDEPQQNGTAERASRWLKSRCRTNLRAAGFPPEHWPVAMRAAAAQQRSEVLGMATKVVWCKVSCSRQGLRVSCRC